MTNTASTCITIIYIRVPAIKTNIIAYSAITQRSYTKKFLFG